MSDIDREWTQQELREHLVGMGWTAEQVAAEPVIPQGVKYISNEPLTEDEIAWAKRLIAEHPEWQKGRR